MKKWIISKCMCYINNSCNYSEEKLKEIEYGLGSIYLAISKTIVILFAAIVLRIFKEVILFMLFFSVIRTFAFGIHATKGWKCWISSIIIFLVIPYISKYIVMNILIIQLICLICVLLIFKNAPADTKKRPIVSKKRRSVLKTISTLIAIIYSCIAICLNNCFITNCLTFSLILEGTLISPTIYKLFKLPYNNYKVFLKNHPNFSKC